MKLRLPLYGKLLSWLLLNLLLLLALLIAMSGESGIGWQSLLSQPVREHLFTIGQSLGRELSARERSDWQAVLDDYGARYGARFECCEDGRQSGRPPPMPRDFAQGPAAEFGWGPGGPMLAAPPRDFDGRDDGPPPDDRNPARRIGIERLADGFQVRVPVLIGRAGEPRWPTQLTVSVPTLIGLVRFLGVQHWLAFPLLGVLLSVLLWLPLLGYLTRSVSRLQQATGDIAEGRYDVRVELRSRDELGQLSESINRMAERLQRQVDTQRRFLADIAHEVTSPLSRLQIGLGIMEARAGDADRTVLADLQEDAEQMAGLLRELLLFSRADSELAQRAQAERFDLRGVLDEVIRRDGAGAPIEITGDADLQVFNYRPFIVRALSNLIRNALRYAGDAGPVELRVSSGAEEIQLAVVDHGPGVADEALPRLGEAFYRPEFARSRDSGGFGLGLAIVQRCIQACGGTASFRNRRDGARGFEAALRFPRHIGT